MRVSKYILGVSFAVDGVFLGAAAAQAGMNPSRSRAGLTIAGTRSSPSGFSSRGTRGGAATAPGGAISAFSLPVTVARNRRSDSHCDDDRRSRGRCFSSASESRGGIHGGDFSAGREAWGMSGSFCLDSGMRAVGGATSGRRSLSLGALPAGSGGGRGGGGERGRLTTRLSPPSSSAAANCISRLCAAPFRTWASWSPPLPHFRQRQSSPLSPSLAASTLPSALAFAASTAGSPPSARCCPPASSFSSSADNGGATPTNAPGDDDSTSSPNSDASDESNGNINSNSKGESGLEWPAPHPAQAYVARARCGQRYEHDVEAGGATRIKVVVSDLDGTLLGPNKLVSATTLGAVREARAKGIIFVPASGRSKAGMISSMGELGEDLKRDGAPLVCMNGLTVYGQADDGGDHGEIIHSELMCSKLAAQVVAFWKTHPLAQAAGVSLCGSEGETIVVESLDARTRSFTDYREPMPREVGNWEDAIAGGMGLNRLYFWGETRAAVDAFQDDLKAHLKDNPAELTRGVPEMIEVLPYGASKAVGLEALLNHLGVSPHEVIALGDMENDVEMLQAVGHGVAMGQASLEVRQAAQFTAPTNALDGVAVALETFCGVRLSG